MKIPFSSDISLVTWKLHSRGINSEEALDEVVRMYEDLSHERDAVGEQALESQVVEESNSETEYHVIVQINHTPDTKVD